MMSAPGPISELFGRVAYEFMLVQPLIPTYLHLLASAVFPIFAGSHASLTRPSSAAKPEKKRAKKEKEGIDEDEDSDEEEEQRMEGLSPSDAILFPLLAGATLAGLYFLLKWLKDPTLLNKILNWYFAIFGVFSVARLVSDCLDVAHSILYPKRYADRGVLYHVHATARQSTPIGASNSSVQPRNSPLPGVFGRISLSEKMLDFFWSDFSLPRRKLTIRLYLRKIVSVKIRAGLHEISGLVCGLATVLYFNLVDKPWFLTNLLGFGFSYGALQVMSPTTFGTGSLILAALFFYDIYFVFFTPMMVTVAKSLDIPIKLVFPRPTPPGAEGKPAHAMLGLGDVVLPGIMIGLALRFDYHLFYLRQQTRAKKSSTSTDGTEESKEDGEVVKPRYIALTGRWGEHFWTHSWFGRSLFTTSPNDPQPHTTFPKPYFYASISGYIIGMLTTLAVMQIWDHAQPALLYLVPGVLGTIWTTALFRGELKDVWNFSEAIEDEEDEKKDSTKSSTKNSSFFSHEKQKRNADKLMSSMNKYIQQDDDNEGETAKKGDDSVNHQPDATKNNLAIAPPRNRQRELFSFSIEGPPPLACDTKAKNSSGNADSNSELKEKDKPNWVAPVKQSSHGEPPEKRLRVGGQ